MPPQAARTAAVAPTRTLTFLFTDIEGSSRLWDEDPEAMQMAVVRHDLIMRHAIQTAGGRVFRIFGDSFGAVFDDACAAVHAALAAQRGLHAELGQGPLALRVCMALHTGPAEIHEGDFAGPPLNLSRRLLAIARGGQILLTGTTAALLGEGLPPGAAVHALGKRSLKDLSGSEPVLQLVAPDLPVNVAPNHRIGHLPQGIVSFLYTDIEGSTTLWEHHPQAMQGALARHNLLMQRAIDTHGGVVFATAGDSFDVAFNSPVEAVSAALAAQRALHAEAWGATPIKVRMGLHTGQADVQEGEYSAALTLNRVARLRDAAHGGQMLISATTAELVRGELPPEVTLRNLGPQRFKGVTQPVRVFQLVVPDLPARFPPLRTPHEQARAARQLWEIVAAVVLLLIVALVGIGGAVEARNTAQQLATAQATALAENASQGRAAYARALADQARAQLDRDPELGVLLGMAAISSTRQFGEPVVPEAEDALRQALLRSPVRLSLRGHTGWVHSAAYSPNGRFVVTASADGTAKIWDVRTGQVTRTLAGGVGGILSAVYSPDGQRVLLVNANHTATIWDPAAGQVRQTLRDPGGVSSAVYSPDGERILFASQDRTAKVWDLAAGRVVLTLRGHTAQVFSAAYSADGRQIVTASADRTATIWDAATGHELLTLPRQTSWVTTGAFSPDGKFLVTAGADGTARVWDAHSGQGQLILQGHTGPVFSAAYSPDSSQIVTAGGDGTTRLWDATTGQGLVILRGHTAGVSSAVYSADGMSIVTASVDGTARIWDAGSGQEGASLRGHLAEVYSAMYSPDQRRIVTASPDGTAKIWDTETGHELLTLQEHTSGMNTAAYSPDGQHIVTANADGIATIWDAATGQAFGRLREPSGPIYSALYSPDGQSILTLGSAETVEIWDAAHQQLRFSLPEAGVINAAFSPDGQRLALACNDNTAKIWNLATRQRVLVLPGHAGYVLSVGWSPDGQSLVTASNDDTARVWDLATGQARLVLRGHTNTVQSAAYSPDGTSIVTASDDGTARLWDARTGQERIALHGPAQGIFRAAYSPDGRWIVTANRDHTARQYVAGLADLLDLAAGRVTRTLTPTERATYLGELRALVTPTVPATRGP